MFSELATSPCYSYCMQETTLKHTCLLPPWCRVLLEQLTGLQLFKKFPAFHGKAHRFEVNGPGSNPGGDEVIRTCPDQPCGPPTLLCNGYRVYFPRVRLPGFGVGLPPQSSAEIKETVELYRYILSGPSLPGLGELYLYLLTYSLHGAESLSS